MQLDSQTTSAGEEPLAMNSTSGDSDLYEAPVIGKHFAPANNECLFSSRGRVAQ